MTQPAIRVENLSKQYQIGSREKGHKTFREALTNLAAAPVRRFQRLSGRSRENETFWALKDVSFEVQPGEVVGVIGRNGAGKSTLLKILTQITEPTTGRATIHGRVASLLEVGTGFHHELTGRENIFLNGSILGMTRAEIKRKFDQIVNFSGVEKFLDTPVKHYSSGMQVRLAFAVAAHLDPEILLVDEVLAVGDAAFQKKCLGKMSSVAKEGRTILFVSHNMVAIEHLTTRTMVLEEGTILVDGQTIRALNQYYSVTNVAKGQPVIDLKQVEPAICGDVQILRSLEIFGNKERTASICTGDDLTFRLRYSASRAIARPRVGIAIETEYGSRILSFGTFQAGFEIDEFHGEGEVICNVERLPLNQGVYSVKLVLADARGELQETYDKALQFEVCPTDVFRTGRTLDRSQGCFVWPCRWQLEEYERRKVVH